jgi:hypothetical protein
MSSGFAGGSEVAPATMRGLDWPCLHQFCVFMENRVGRLHELLRTLERQDLRVVGLSVVDTVDFAVARLIVNDTDRGREVLTLAGFTMTENDILGVVLPEDDQPFEQIFFALMTAELNISYTYPLLYRYQGRGAVALHVDDIDQAVQILKSKGHRVITEGDLLGDGDLFGSM